MISGKLSTKYYNIGKVIKSVGLDGWLNISLESWDIDVLENQKVVFFKVRGNFVPYFIEDIQDAEEIKIKFEEVNSPEDAQQLNGSSIYLNEIQVEGNGPKSFEDFSSMQGYKMYNNAYYIGELISIEEYPMQVMARVSHEGAEHLIPLNDTFLKSIDEAHESIYLELPDGLLNLFS